MRTREHLKDAVCVGALVNVVTQIAEYNEAEAGRVAMGLPLQPFQLDLVRLVLATAATCIGDRVPDTIEPATSPDHRGRFHTWAAGGLVAGVAALASSCMGPGVMRDCTRSLPLGYNLHLAGDSRTPEGIRVWPSTARRKARLRWQKRRGRA